MTARQLEVHADPAWIPNPDLDHIDRRVYTSPAIFEAERDRVFGRSWIMVGVLSDFEKTGDYVSTTIGLDPVVVVKDKEGDLNAFYNTCTHRGTAVAGEPRGNCGTHLQCPYHQWTFDLKGRLAAVPYPAAYGSDFPKDQLGLVPAKVEVCGSLVFAATNPVVPTLRGFLGEAWEWVEHFTAGKEVFGRGAWTYEGNWKLWHENFRDNYHPEFVHGLVHDLEAGFADQGRNVWLEPGHSLMEWPMVPPQFDRYAAGIRKRSGVVVDPTQNEEWQGPRPPEGTPEGDHADEGEHADLPPMSVSAYFPNLDFQAFFTGLVVQRLTPLSPDATRVDITFLAPEGEPEWVRAFRLDHEAGMQGSWGKVSADDTEVCELTQVGLRGRGTQLSNMSRGRAPGRSGETRDEYSMRSFHAEWRKYMYGTDEPTPSED